MGGFGSGERLTKKTTVETCLKLDVADVEQPAVMKRTTMSGGRLTWRNSSGKPLLAVRYWLEFETEYLRILHFSSREEADGTETAFVESILLTGTIPNFGGVRWWFICPLIVNEVICKRRVKKLFLPPGAKYFGCRICYSLTYESAQTHDARIGKLMKNPVALVRAIKSKDHAQALMGIQAYARLRGWV